MARQGKRRSREKDSIQRRSNYRYPEGVGRRGRDRGIVPAARDRAGMFLPAEEQVRRVGTERGLVPQVRPCVRRSWGTAQGEVSLDNAFSLVEGHSAITFVCTMERRKMPTREEMAAFRTTWKVRADNGPLEFARLKSRVISVINGSVGDQLYAYDDEIGRAFALILGIGYDSRSYNLRDFSGIQSRKVLENADSLRALAEALQTLLWAISETRPFILSKLVPALNEAFELSPDILIHCVRHGNKAVLHPGGVKILDEALIDENLIWLGGYPTVAKPFGQALTMYLQKRPEEYRNLLDNLRFSVEQLIQVVLENARSLENQKGPFLKWLRDHNLHSSIVNMYHALLFDKFTKYQNDAVKHGEEYSPLEIEFMLYLTGAFIRLVLRAVQSEPKRE